MKFLHLVDCNLLWELLDNESSRLLTLGFFRFLECLPGGPLIPIVLWQTPNNWSQVTQIEYQGVIKFFTTEAIKLTLDGVYGGSSAFGGKDALVERLVVSERSLNVKEMSKLSVPILF